MAGGGPTNKHGLTPVQEAFAHEYLVDMDPGAAAERAGYNGKNRQAYQRRGNEALKNSKVAQRVHELQEKHSRATDITAEAVLEELGRLFFADPGEIMEWGGGKPVRWRDSNTLPPEVRRQVKEVYETEREMDDGGTYRTKRLQYHDKMAAAKMIMSHLGATESIRDHVQDEVAKQQAGERKQYFEDIDNWRREQEIALPEERPSEGVRTD